MKIIDLSTEINTGFWEPEKIKKKFLDHKKGANKLGKSYLYFGTKNKWEKLVSILFPKKRRITYRDFPDGQGLSEMKYTLSTHTGTHIDAPFHYGYKKKKGPQRTVSDLPLEYFYGDAVLLDFSSNSLAINQDNIISALNSICYTIKKNDIVLIYTGAVAVGTKEYFINYKEIELSAVKYLTSLGVKVIGTDAFSFDPPFSVMIDAYQKTKDKNVLWPAHFYGRDVPYIQIERLSNLDKINKRFDFKVCCFPIKLKDADASWCRAVALVG